MLQHLSSVGRRLLPVWGLFIIEMFGMPDLHAQYRIDLSQIQHPELHYIPMGHSGPEGKEIRINNLYWEEAGEPRIPVMGEFHYNRMDERYWRESLMKMKSSGVNIVSTYNLWVLHEEFEGRQDWSGRNDLRRFVELCQEVGLKVHLRPGPYCNAEIRNGGFPDWLLTDKQLKPRTNDSLYLEYVRYWYRSVFKQVEGLLYKDGGPIVGIQLENEYVTKGQVVPHITTLKQIAREVGFDVPVYSMTHWMMSDYPKGEVIPYAGYYLETPWISYGTRENPTTDQEFFSYNRISDNIGNDMIKISAQMETLDESSNDSPYFTCEMGLGTPSYYYRRAVVGEELAGENINLRLGCGVNLMGYYLYVGQTNPIGQQYTTARSTARVSNDYQAPIREFGQVGEAMKETKKMNYFMNDFGHLLAPLRAYLPLSNRQRDNLQWAVRTDGQQGYLFCSNILHKHPRKAFRDVQFTLQLHDGPLTLPRRKVTIPDRAYFFWPFQMDLDGITLVYATAQPICHLEQEGTHHYFFFEDDGIPAEFRFQAESVATVETNQGQVKRWQGDWLVEELQAGKSCQIKLTAKDGTPICITLLTEPESDLIWKGKVGEKPFVALSQSFLYTDRQQMFLASESPTQQLQLFSDGRFTTHTYTSHPHHTKVQAISMAPLSDAQTIRPNEGQWMRRCFDATHLAPIECAYLRMLAHDSTRAYINNMPIATQSYAGYRYADLSEACRNGLNEISFQTVAGTNQEVTAEVEVLLANGTRWVWATDALWRSTDGTTPVQVVPSSAPRPKAFDPREHLALYQVPLPDVFRNGSATRLYLNVTGDVAQAYLAGHLIHDVLINGDDWVIGLDRYTHLMSHHPMLTVRIDGLKSAETNIYFEQALLRPTECLQPRLRSLRIEQENVVKVDFW